MNKYVVRLEDSAITSPAAIERVTQELANQGARNVEVHALGLVTVDSPVPLNFAGITDIVEAQEVREVNENEIREQA